MEEFSMEIAGVSIRVHPMFQSTKEYCRPYLTDREPELFVRITAEDLVHEQMLLEKQAIDEGLKIRKFKDPFLERSIIQRRVADYLLSRNTLMLHGSTVAVDGQAYLFTAPCGTGKSTHTRLWREVFGDRAVMVNDDKPFLRIAEDSVLAYGSPWSGKHGLAANVRVPLRGICALRRSKDNRIYSVDSGTLMDLLLHQTHIPDDADLARKARELLALLVDRVSLWEMECNRDLDAARVAYSAMGNVQNNKV